MVTNLNPTVVGTVNTGGDSESKYPTEWIFPNSGDGKYFTSAQCRVYIGDLFIDEIDTIYFNYSNNRIPVYGYSSADPDAFGQGRRLVQGQLALNFVSEGYLYTVVSEYDSKYSSAPSSNTNQSGLTTLADLYKQQASLYTLVARGDSSSATQQSLASVSQQITQLHAKLGSSSVAAVKKILKNETTATSTTNAIKKDVAFDIIIQATGGGRTISRKLHNCVLTSNEQVWDQSDNSIKDVYGFVGVELV